MDVARIKVKAYIITSKRRSSVIWMISETSGLKSESNGCVNFFWLRKFLMIFFGRESVLSIC